MEKRKIGIAMTGSFCTFAKVLAVVQDLAEEFELVPIMSENSYTTDTRFGTAAGFVQRLEEITGKQVIHTIAQAEPIGPKKMLDALVVMPCTGNTLAKMACGITDTTVTMAAKSHRRNRRPVILGVSTNDALGASGTNIGKLMNDKYIYFIPMRQDDPVGKENSLVAEFSLARRAIWDALEGRQTQPVLLPCGPMKS